MLSPGSSRTSHMRMCSFSNRSVWPTGPSSMPRFRAASNPYGSISSTPARWDHRDGVDLDQIVRGRHLGDLDHRGGGQRRLEVLGAHLMDGVEVLHVAHINVDAADVVERAAGAFDRRLHVLTHLARLLGDVADAGNAA